MPKHKTRMTVDELTTAVKALRRKAAILEAATFVAFALALLSACVVFAQ